MTFLLVCSLALLSSSPAHASGHGIARLIERPVARFLLTETTEGRELVDRVLRHVAPPRHYSPEEMAEFSRVLEDAFHWQDVAIELRRRVGSAEREVASLRKLTASAGSFDAAEFLRAYAARDFRVITNDRYYRFAEVSESSFGAVRERFLAETGVPEAFYAPMLSLDATLDKLLVRARSLDRVGAEQRALQETIDRFRSTALEVAVQSSVNPRAYWPLQDKVANVRVRLSQLVEKLLPVPGQERAFQVFTLQRELRKSLAETQIWFQAAP